MAEAFAVETEACLVWTAKKPYADHPRESPTFILQNCRYSLRLEIQYMRYCLYLQDKTDPNESLYYGVTVGIFSEVNPTTYRSAGRRTSSDCIWHGEISHMEKDLPNFNTLRFFRFRIIFHSVPASMLHIEQKADNKSVQTSSYLDTHSHFEELSRDFAKLLGLGSSPDVELTCGDHTQKAHRNVLISRSDVFSAMLQSDMVEGKTGRVKIQDVEPAIFQEFLQYLYTGKLPDLTVDTAKRFYEAADKYGVEGLKQRCASYLREHLTGGNACEILTLADRHSDPDFRESVIGYILDEKIPFKDGYWKDFCDSQPALANQVLNRFCQLLGSKLVS